MEIDLLSVGGLTLFLTLLVQIAVKPSLDTTFPKDEEGERDPKYGIIINLVTLALAIVISTLANLTTWVGVDSILTVLVISVAATAGSIGVYEVSSNTYQSLIKNLL